MTFLSSKKLNENGQSLLRESRVVEGLLTCCKQSCKLQKIQKLFLWINEDWNSNGEWHISGWNLPILSCQQRKREHVAALQGSTIDARKISRHHTNNGKQQFFYLIWKILTRPLCSFLSAKDILQECVRNAVINWRSFTSTSKLQNIRQTFALLTLGCYFCRNQLIRKQNELLQFLNIAEEKIKEAQRKAAEQKVDMPEEALLDDDEEFTAFVEADDEDEEFEELIEGSEALNEEEISDNFNVSDYEMLEYIEEENIIEALQSESESESAAIIDTKELPKAKQNAPRLEEVRYEKVEPSLVLTPKFLQARENLRQNHDEDAEPSDYVVATLVSNDYEKIVFICSNLNCKAEFQSESEMKLHLADHKVKPGALKCEQCDTVFKSRHYYEKHMDTAHSVDEHICQICGVTMESRVKWRSHMRNHNKTLRFHCTYEGCEKAFRVKHHLDNHMRVHSKNSPFKCTFSDCTASFRQKHALTVHLRKHTGEVITCDKCDSPFVTLHHLNKHQTKCNGTFKPLVTRKFLTKVDSKDCESFSCALCDESFRTKMQIDKHLLRAHEFTVLPTMCIHCLNQFSTPQEMKIHMREHLPFTCELCSVSFKNEEAFHNHKLKHEEGDLRLHKCSDCSAKFKRPEHLKSHIVYKHSTDRPFSCDLCPYMSPTRHDLNNHMKTHIQKRDWPCRFCNFSAKTLSSIKCHLKTIHDTQEFYFCPLCSRSFKYQNELSHHHKKCFCWSWGLIWNKCSISTEFSRFFIDLDSFAFTKSK